MRGFTTEAQRQRVRFLSAPLCLYGLLFASIASAQDWKAEWDRTVAAAEKEGEIVLQSQPNQAARDFILREFPKAYPKIKVSLSVVPEAQFGARVRTERQADKYLWDLAVSGTSGGFNLAKDNILDPLRDEFILPEVKDEAAWGGWNEAFMDLEKKYVLALSSFAAGPWYNALVVKLQKVQAGGLKYLLDPELRGRIVWHDPTIAGGGRVLAQLLRAKLGDDGLRALIIDQKPFITPQQHQVMEGIARGTHWVGIGPPVRSLIAPFTQAGIKVEMRNFGNGPEVALQSVGGSALYVISKRPHPNATRVFVNWIMSKDTSYALAKALDQGSRRRDIDTHEPDSVVVPGVSYVTPQREEMIDYVNETTKVIEAIRKQAP
jgi:ABC-type Fe3+ transport system substrate-binding protein